jgi:hypothetical protein
MSPSAEAVPVQRARLAEVWPAVEPLLTPALKRGGEMTMQGLVEALRDGRFVLWLAWSGRLEAAAVTEVADTIAGRVCCIVACGGRDRARWLDLRADLETYARRAGCVRMRIYGRKGWLRALPDFRAARVILEKEL